jgi:hypothetical protein
MALTFVGPGRGVGSRYRCTGNRKAGEGETEIIESSPSRVLVALRFLRPFEADNLTRFDLAETSGADFERGLSALRASAET